MGLFLQWYKIKPFFLDVRPRLWDLLRGGIFTMSITTAVPASTTPRQPGLLGYREVSV